MKKVLFASSALAALAIGGAASAQGISLFGTARLGLGYGINNDGTVRTDDGGVGSGPSDDLRAVSRVRFGVNMTGETNSGITFGATIRADNAINGNGNATNGQSAGEVFVSGSFGTLTFGDTNGADEQWVGDVPGNYSLTGMGDLNETKFVSNGGSFGNDTGNTFASNPEARPTVRYDFDIMGFGVSVSSNRDLTDVTVGLGYAADFGGGSWTVGAGYNTYDSFEQVGDPVYSVDPVTGDVVITTPTNFFPDGEQWSVGLGGEYDAFAFGVTYVKLTSDTDTDGNVEVDNILVGASYSFDAFSVGAVYGNILSAEGGEDINAADGDDSFVITGEYDLGGGASINGGIGQTYGGTGDDGQDSATIADFGIKMAF
jgi:outer membrane protein OmpU